MSQVEVDKIIPQSGTTLTIGDSGDTIAIASGATLTGDLNADNLTSGTVPSARVSGAYTGITQTGTLASFASTGIDDNATSTAVTIDSSGNLLVGKTAIAFATVGGELRENGQITGTRDGNASLILNRLNSDGDIAKFYKDGTVFGSIRNDNSNNLIIGNATRGLKYRDTDVIPRDMDDTTSDNQVTLGSTGSRFADIYLGGGLYVGGTGTANKLDDYEEGTWTPNVGGNATYTVQTGDYIKIGKLVYVTGIIQINNLGTGSNTTIVGLPFSGDSSNPYNGSVGYFSSLASSIVNITPYNQLGNTNINFRTLTSASNSSGTSNTIFQNGTRVDFSLTYTTA